MNETRFSNLLYKQYNNSIKDFLTAFHQVFTVWSEDQKNVNAFENWKYFILATYNAGENEMRKNPKLFSTFVDLLMQQGNTLSLEMFIPNGFLLAQIHYLIEDMTDTEIEELEQKAQELTIYWESKLWNRYAMSIIHKLYDGTDKLSAQELEIHYLNKFEECIYIGGFMLFYESGSIFFQKTIALLNQVKAFQCINLLQQAYALIQPYLQKEELPENYLSIIPNNVFEALHKIDEAIWKNYQNLDALFYKYYFKNKHK